MATSHVHKVLHEQKTRNYLLLFLLVLTGFFVLAEISFLLQSSQLYFGDIKLVADHLVIPWSVVLPGICYFFLVQLCLHLGFVFFVWLLAVGAGSVLRLSPRKIEILGIILWFITLTAILLHNQLHYPNSKFARFVLPVSFPQVSLIIYWIICILLAAISLLAFAGYCFRFFSADSRRRWGVLRNPGVALPVIAGVLFAGAHFFYGREQFATRSLATAARPNIIVVGIDSLRPDYLGFSGAGVRTPFLDHFLEGATFFAEAMTPLARTYPAWTSILTGLYPKHSGARTDLYDDANLDLSQTLPAMLKQAGYQTLYATDETRFSNIDARYGFDSVETPPIGFNDFLLGTMNDFPISNLFINTVAGRYLFPYTYANRAVFPLYDPDSFLRKLDMLLSRSRQQPLFFAIHFCLPHYPYAWASLPVGKVQLRHYVAAIERVDRQFRDFMRLLDKRGLLQHGLVVLLSDHGEGVERQGDRITDPDLYVASQSQTIPTIPHFYPPSATHEKVNMSGGHGTDVLGLPQYHTVLAFHGYGLTEAFSKGRGRRIPGLASLMDIRATVLNYLHLAAGKTDGISLLPQITGESEAVSPREDYFVESDFSPAAVRSVHPEVRKVLFEGINYFHINQHTARITVRGNMLRLIVSSKQYADYSGNWVLALYPQGTSGMLPVLVDLQTGEWSTSLASPFAQHSPAQKLLAALRGFYGKDIGYVKNT